MSATTPCSGMSNRVPKKPCPRGVCPVLRVVRADTVVEGKTDVLDQALVLGLLHVLDPTCLFVDLAPVVPADAVKEVKVKVLAPLPPQLVVEHAPHISRVLHSHLGALGRDHQFVRLGPLLQGRADHQL